MQFTFADTLPAAAALVASIANKDSLPDGIEPVLAEAAKRGRFKGSAGQLVEGFVERDGKVVRVALAGAGDPKAKARLVVLGCECCLRFRRGPSRLIALSAIFSRAFFGFRSTAPHESHVYW